MKEVRNYRLEELRNREEIAKTTHKFVLDGVARKLDKWVDMLACSNSPENLSEELMRDLVNLSKVLSEAYEDVKRAIKLRDSEEQREKNDGFAIEDMVVIKGNGDKAYMITALFPGEKKAALSGYNGTVKLSDLELYTHYVGVGK